MFPILLKKAIQDAGFDLTLGTDGEWLRIGISGLEGYAWVLPSGKGALVALQSEPPAGEFQLVTWTDVPMPNGAVRAFRCASAADLYQALRRVRVLVAEKPPLPEQQLAAKLASIPKTEAEAIVKQRIGQEKFREMLMDYWDGRCAVTGLAVPELLRASHAKPWKDATDKERLDPYNGFLLAVHLDALFDRGLMTFTDDGEAEFSPVLAPEALRMLVPGADCLRLRRVTDGHRPYLEWHRERVFRRG